MAEPTPVTNFEIMTKNPESGQEFYRQLFGWQITNNPSNYGMVKAQAGGIGGGVGDAGDRTWVTIYVQVADLQATLDKAVAMGGKVVLAPTPLPFSRSKIAQFTDPDGNLIGLRTK